MGGELTVQSEVGKGSVFRFYIPVKHAIASDVTLVKSKRNVLGLVPDQPAYRLLIVDENESNRRLLVSLLGRLGFEVKEADNGLEAVKQWQHWYPHLIFMDMRMPVMVGYEATERIKRHPRGKDTKIIALTASAFEDDRVRILSLGCDDFVRKPYQHEEIFDILNEHLGARFVYEGTTTDVDEGAPEKKKTIETTHFDQAVFARQLANIPQDLVDELESATTLGSLDNILSSTDNIRALDRELAQTLEVLAGNFEHDKILALIEDSEQLR